MHNITNIERQQMLDKIKNEPKRVDILALVIATTSHIIEYPPHWQINFHCGKLDRLFEGKNKEVRDGEW